MTDALRELLAKERKRQGVEIAELKERHRRNMQIVNQVDQ